MSVDPARRRASSPIASKIAALRTWVTRNRIRGVYSGDRGEGSAVSRTDEAIASLRSAGNHFVGNRPRCAQPGDLGRERRDLVGTTLISARDTGLGRLGGSSSEEDARAKSGSNPALSRNRDALRGRVGSPAIGSVWYTFGGRVAASRHHFFLLDSEEVFS